MMDLFPITLNDVRAEIEREIAMRRSVYARRVSDKKMSQEEADRQIALMKKAGELLEGLPALQRENKHLLALISRYGDDELIATAAALSDTEEG